MKDDLAMVQILVKELHADVNKADDVGRTPLWVTAQKNDLSMVRCLAKELGADVNKADSGGLTTLLITAHKGDFAMVRVLVKELHADVNKGDQEGFSPLWIAAAERNICMVQCLVKELGADIDQANRLGGTPLMIASAYKHADIVKWLVKAGANTQALMIVGDGSQTTAATISNRVGASPEQTAYLEAKTHCSSPGCNGAGVMNLMHGMQAGAVLRRGVPAGELEGAQSRLQTVERGAGGGRGQRESKQVMESHGVCHLR
jgi:ankyrin repeat protein